MKVATLFSPEAPRIGGAFVVVSDDLTTCQPADTASFQDALDRDDLCAVGEAAPFKIKDCAAPLPRAFQFLDASAYVNHVALVRQARGAEMPEHFWTDPLMYQGVSDSFLSPYQPIAGDPRWGIDFEAEVAVITHAIAQGATAEEAAAAIRYIVLMNDVSLRNLIPAELAKGFGFVQSKPPSSFSPVAVAAADCPGWDGRKLHGTMRIDLNGAPFGRVETGEDMTFDFGVLLAHAAKTRPLGAGTILGSGTISNRDQDGGPGKTIAEGGRGYACIAEQRMVETITSGAAKTPFLQPGDRVKIWMEDAQGNSIFGAIDQEVKALT
ncbi:fumarylacetoacetate hydrolase family protein [Yoonia sp. BS5-3]|uniref:Fumarylacetoacetate hydrolase family protein n=1 Tax=Yoonia phaeophyticola TaxID=3137369 RepID=A0ABZ2V863_9RHOB